MSRHTSRERAALEQYRRVTRQREERQVAIAQRDRITSRLIGAALMVGVLLVAAIGMASTSGGA